MNAGEFAVKQKRIKKEYMENRNYKRAIVLLNDLKHKLDNETFIDDAYYPWYVNYDLGYCYNLLEDYETSNKYMEESLEYVWNIKDPNCCKSLWMMANNYAMLQEKQLAREYYYSLLKIFRLTNNRPNRLLILMNVAWLNDNMEQLLRLTQYFTKIDYEEIIKNSDVYIDRIIPSIINLAKEIKEGNELCYNKIIGTLHSSPSLLIRKKLLTLSC